MKELTDYLEQQLLFKRVQFKRVHKEYLKEKKRDKYSHISGVYFGQRTVIINDVYMIVASLKLYRTIK